MATVGLSRNLKESYKRSVDPDSIRSIDETNERIEKLKLNNFASHGRGDIPGLTFGSISLSSQIRSKFHPETTKNEVKKKIEFPQLKGPLSPKETI